MLCGYEKNKALEWNKQHWPPGSKNLFCVEKWHAAKPERIARADHVRTRQRVGRLHISSCEAGVEAWYPV